MKKIILFIGVLLALNSSLMGLTIDECKTDIYFGNGVWNAPEDAEKGRQKLQKEIVVSKLIQGDPKLQAKYGEVKLQYNWGQGGMLDVLETYYQLKEAGQVNDYQFFAVILILTKGNAPVTLSAVTTQQLMESFTSDWEQGNVDEMWNKYYEESFKLSHKVLLISHSQGNLFANRIHDSIVPTQYQDYFANLQIASPASEVKALKGDYVTGSVDPVINPIPGSMDANAVLDTSGHALVEAYLSSSDTLEKIVSKTRQLLNTLDSESSQWQTDQEIAKDTVDYRITVKHRFDESVIMNEEVYPFEASKKLYQTKDILDNDVWVKASCGGEKVLTTWENQKESEFYLLQGTDEMISIGGVFTFIVEYYYKIANYTEYNPKGSIANKLITPDGSCGYESGSGYRNISSLSSDEVYLGAGLDGVRNEYEIYFYNSFPSTFSGAISKQLNCYLGQKNDSIESYNILNRSNETRRIIEDDKGIRRYILEQEYTLKI